MQAILVLSDVIRVLGPLEAFVGVSPLPLPGGKSRAAHRIRENLAGGLPDLREALET